MQLQDLAGGAAAGHQVRTWSTSSCSSLRRAIGAGRPEATSPGAAAGSRRRCRGRAPSAHLVDVQLLELDVLHVTAKAYPALIWDST